MLSILKMRKRDQIIRCFLYQNLHQIGHGVNSVTLFYSLQKDVSLVPLIRLSSLLELVAHEKSCLTRSKQSSASLKNRKGAPVGVKLTLHSFFADYFLTKFIWEILPQIRRFSSTGIKKSNRSAQPVFNLVVPDPLIFPSLADFYFLFRNCFNLRVTISPFSSRSHLVCNFYKRLFQVPA